MTNCLVYGNYTESSGYGGCAVYATVPVVNCTIVSNTVPSGAAACAGKFINCIIADNTKDIWNFSKLTSHMTNCLFCTTAGTSALDTNNCIRVADGTKVRFTSLDPEMENAFRLTRRSPALKLTPGFEVLGENDVTRPTVGCHRRDGETDLFFVANLSSNAVRRTLAFCVTAKEPEIWNPETGARQTLAFWRETEGRTVLERELGPNESFFVVFRREGKPAAKAPTEAKARLIGPVRLIAR